MTSFIVLLALIIGLAALTTYARRDHFAGPANVAERHDELGSLALSGRVRVR